MTVVENHIPGRDFKLFCRQLAAFLDDFLRSSGERATVADERSRAERSEPDEFRCGNVIVAQLNAFLRDTKNVCYQERKCGLMSLPGGSGKRIHLQPAAGLHTNFDLFFPHPAGWLKKQGYAEAT